MTDHLLFLIVGLGAGAAYAAIGMAVVTTYRGTGVINIAQGAMAMWAAFVYDELRRQGDLVLPVGRVDLGDGLATWPALAAGVAAVAVLGLLLHLVVFRPLRSAPPLAKVVASVGVAITLQALVVLRFGTGRRAVPPALPDDPVRIGALSFSRDRIWFAALVVAIAVMLWAYGRFTRAGLATRAAAESERGAILLGYSPDRLAAATWVLSAVVGGTVAVFVSPSVGLEPTSWTLMVVPGLACALLGRLTSVGVTCAAGLALGAVESEITLLSARAWWPDWATVGVAESVPLLVIVAALGLLVAVPALRVRGVQLAVVTLAAGVAIENFVFENPRLTPTTGNIIPDPRLLGLDLGVRRGAEVARWQFGILVLVVLALAALAVANLIRSGTGRALLAVRSNERAAASLGVDVAAAKLVAFGMSAFLAGLGGALIGYSRGQLSATSFGVSVSLTLLAFAYLGGITSVGGALVAGTLAPLGIGYVVLDRATDLGEHYLLVSGMLLVATAVLNPGGTAGTVRGRVAAVRARLGGPGAAAATPLDQTAEAEHPPVAVGAPP